MKFIRYWRRIALMLAGLGAGLGALLGAATAASAATAMLPPPESDRGAAPALQPVVVGGMPGWQIALIAVGAALAAAAITVLLGRARLGRRQLSNETA